MNYMSFILPAAKKYAWWLGLFFLAINVGTCFVLRGNLLLYRLIGISTGVSIIFAFSYRQHRHNQCMSLWRVFISKLSHALPLIGSIFFAQLVYYAFIVSAGQIARYQFNMITILISAVLLTALWNYLRQAKKNPDECLSVNDVSYVPDQKSVHCSYLRYGKKGLLFLLAFLGVDAFYEYAFLPFYTYDSYAFWIIEPLVFGMLIYFSVIPFMAQLLLPKHNRIMPYLAPSPGTLMFYVKRHFYLYMVCLGIYDTCISLIALRYQPSIIGYFNSFDSAQLKDFGAYSLTQKLTISTHIFPSWFFIASFVIIVLVGSLVRWFKQGSCACFWQSKDKPF